MTFRSFKFLSRGWQSTPLADESDVSTAPRPDPYAALSAAVTGWTNLRAPANRSTAIVSSSPLLSSGLNLGLSSASQFHERFSKDHGAGQRIAREALEGFQQASAPVMATGVARAAKKTKPATQKILAFSGGGWNSQSTLAGLISGALQKSGKGIDKLLRPFQQVSGNSGGTWFLSLLAYSKGYVDSLSKISKNSAGMDVYQYNADLRSAFGALSLNPDASAIELVTNFLASLDIDSGIVDLIVNELPYTAGLLYEALAGGTSLSWSNFINKFVYDYPFLGGNNLKGLNLDSPRLDWAGGKDLTFALAVNSTPAVLLDRGFSISDPATLINPYEKYFSSLTPDSQNSPWWTSFIAAVGEKPAALPLLVVSEASPDGKRISSYAELPFGVGQLNFKNNPTFGQQNLSVSIGQRFATRGFSLIDATTGSSSAAGLLAAPDTYVAGSANTDGISVFNQLANELRKLSPVTSFAGGNLASVRESQAAPETINSLSEAADQGLARLLDGGYVDNTSVSYAIREMQTSAGVTAPFEVTLMMNSNVDPVTGLATMPGGVKIAGDVAVLFGMDYRGDPLKDGVAVPFVELGQPFPPMPSAQVFDISAWNQVKAPRWTYVADNNTFSINFYSLDVTTVANPVLGISAGQKGKLNIVATNNSQSCAAPVSLSVLDEYDQNFTYVRDALIAKGGWEAMKSAF